jgi:hypothetical protein
MKEKITLSPCKRVIQITEPCLAQELADAMNCSLSFVTAMVKTNGVEYEKLGKRIVVYPQTITLKKKSRKKAKQTDFYVFSEDKERIKIIKECSIADLADVLNVTYLAAQKLLKNRNIGITKNDKGFFEVPKTDYFNLTKRQKIYLQTA